METRELLNKLKGQDVALEIQYVNSAGISNKHVIDCFDLETSGITFDAYAFNVGKKLTFAIGNVKSIKVLTLENTPSFTLGKGYRQWTYVFSEDFMSKEDGIYMIGSFGQGWDIFVHVIEKNMCLSEFTGHSWKLPFPFYYISPYKNISQKNGFNSGGWVPVDSTLEEHVAHYSGHYFRAFVFEGEKVSDYYIEDYGIHWGSFAHNYPGEEKSIDGICYDLRYFSKGWDICDGECPFPYSYYDTIPHNELHKRILGYYAYSYEEIIFLQGGRLWDLYKKLKNASEQKYGELNNEK